MGISTQTLGLTIGWLAIGWVAAQAVVFSVRTIRQRIRWRRQYLRERADFSRRVEATARATRAAKAIPDWNGWRPFRVAAIVDEARDVKSFYFTPVDSRPLSPFAPGQYLIFRLPASDGAAPLVRCYSLSDRPREDFYRATIKRLSAPPDRPGLPPGRGSSYFYDRVQVGDTLDVRAGGNVSHRSAGQRAGRFDWSGNWHHAARKHARNHRACRRATRGVRAIRLSQRRRAPL